VAAGELVGDAGRAALDRLLEACEGGGVMLHVTDAGPLLGAPDPRLGERLAGFAGVALLSVDSVAALDPALRASLTVRVPFPPPDEAARALLWRRALRSTGSGARAAVDDGGVDVAALAAHPLGGAAIEASVARAALLAAAEGTAPTTGHYQRAAQVELASGALERQRG